MPVIKTLVRVGVIGTLVGGGLLAVAGPDRVGAALSQARDRVNDAIDSNIDDPVKMRAQLRKLEAQYPERIARVQQDLNSLDRQVVGYERELAVANRVVELAHEDLAQMHGLFDQVETAQASARPGTIVRVRFGGESMDLDTAQARAVQIQKTKEAYAVRAQDIARDLDLLGRQRERLVELRDKLHAERADFEAQLWQLNQQIDAIARNERMIDMMEARQKTLDELGPFEANSAQHVFERIAQTRHEQEQRLEQLDRRRERLSYEDQAKLSLEGSAPRQVIELGAPVLELPQVEVDQQPKATGRKVF
ncbi:MAG: hypothetical protein AAFX79_04585 [Planctomycetota bacterium]